MKSLVACAAMFTIAFGIVAFDLLGDVRSVSTSAMDCFDQIQLNTRERECMQTVARQANKAEVKAKVIGAVLVPQSQ